MILCIDEKWAVLLMCKDTPSPSQILPGTSTLCLPCVASRCRHIGTQSLPRDFVVQVVLPLTSSSGLRRRTVCTLLSVRGALDLILSACKRRGPVLIAAWFGDELDNLNLQATVTGEGD